MPLGDPGVLIHQCLNCTENCLAVIVSVWPNRWAYDGNRSVRRQVLSRKGLFGVNPGEGTHQSETVSTDSRSVLDVYSDRMSAGRFFGSRTGL